MKIENYKIRKYRKKFNLRQEDLAKKLNLSTQLIRMYENGTRNPSFEKKKEICSLFNISLSELNGITDREDLKRELKNKINTFKLSEEEFEELKSNIITNFSDISKNNSNLLTLLTNDNSQIYELQACIIEFILENYIAEYSSKDSKNEHIIYDLSSIKTSTKIHKLVCDFIVSNIVFINFAIDGLIYPNKDSTYTIPIIHNIVDSWEKIIKNAKEFIFIYQPSITIGKKLYGYRVTNNEMAIKYEIGNVAIFEWTNKYSNNDDVIIFINNEAKFRRIHITKTGIFIQPLNQLYETEFYSKEDIERLNIKVIGRVVAIHKL